MKGEIIMDNVNVQFLVLKVEEQKLNTQPYRVDVSVVGSFKNLEDARKCKEAKDTLNNITPNEYDWCKTQFKVQQIFYKSLVQADKKSA
mgnify:FL=1|tara:strand:- start:105 stop:371 length:267 start_codon:yes stop_codon:yes gene_type:complete